MSEMMGSRSEESAAERVVLEVRNADVTFEMSRGRAHVLNDVNIDIRRGETLGIVGESGCGKSMFGSTLLDAVEDPGILTGEIVYHPPNGEPIELLDLSTKNLNRVRWEEIATVHQGSKNAFNPNQTMRTHFTETLKAHNADKEEGMERARELLRDVNLNPNRIFDAYQHELSGGEKQRTMLALGLILDPEVLILDEPTAGLDLLTQRQILNILSDIKEQYDLTVVLITHDLPIVSGIADRLAVMYAFEIVEIGETRDVLFEPKHPYTRLLLRSTLNLTQSLENIDVIEGQTPDPINIPIGCPFHPRCPVAQDRCEVDKPELRSPEESDHSMACFYPDIATDEIPTPIEQEGINASE